MPATESQPTGRLAAWLRRYAAETRRPLVCLAFAAPLLLVYEVGVVAFPEAARNGADVWMRGWLSTAGLGGYFLLPALTVCVLLAWHHTTRQPWRLPRGVLALMLVESVLLGSMLLVVAHTAAAISAAPPAVVALQDDLTAVDKTRLVIAQPAIERVIQRVIEYVGAGLYEEVLFRLLLLPALIAALAAWLKNGAARTALAVGATSVLFAAAHHIGAHGEAYVAGVFLFRALAGVFFAVLFLRRGFGIAIGAHAAYDLIVGLAY